MLRFKTLSTITHKCPVCEQYSECTIEKWQNWIYVHFLPVPTGNGYSFSWRSCNHSVLIDKPEIIKRYKVEQVDTGLFGIPPVNELKLFERTKPRNRTSILVFSLFTLIICGILIYTAWALVSSNP